MDREVDVAKYFSTVLSNAKEFESLASAENPEYKRLYDLALRWFKNGFVLDLYEDGATRWEEMLSLVPKAGDTLEQRRQRILSKITSLLPYTHRRLEEILATTYGKGNTSLDFEYDKYILNVDIAKSVILQKEALFYLMRMIVPANLIINIRYTFEVPVNGYFAAVMGRRNRLKITTATGYNLTEATANIYFAGIVGIRKRIKIKAVM